MSDNGSEGSCHYSQTYQIDYLNDMHMNVTETNGSIWLPFTTGRGNVPCEQNNVATSPNDRNVWGF